MKYQTPFTQEPDVELRSSVVCCSSSINKVLQSRDIDVLMFSGAEQSFNKRQANSDDDKRHVIADISGEFRSPL